jgi:hypothetical protein
MTNFPWPILGWGIFQIKSMMIHKLKSCFPYLIHIGTVSCSMRSTVYHFLVGKVANKYQESLHSKEYYQQDRIKLEK